MDYCVQSRGIFFFKRRFFKIRNTAILFLWLTGFVWLFALEGRVVDESGEPVTRAYVSAAKFSTFTDSSGEFVYGQNLGKLEVSHPDYYSQTLRLSSPVGTPVKTPVQMTPVQTTPVKTIVQINSQASQEVAFPSQKRLEIILVAKPERSPQSSSEVVTLAPSESLAQGLKRRFYLKGHNLAGESQEICLSGQKAKNSAVLWENIPLNMSGQPLDLGNFGWLWCDSARVDIFNPASSSAVGGELNLSQSLRSQKRVVFLQSIGSYNLTNSLLQIDGYTQNYNYRLGYSVLQADNDYDYTDYWGKECRRENNAKKIENLVLTLDGHSFKFRQVSVFFERNLPGATNERDYFTNAKSSGYRTVSALNYRHSFDWLELSGDVGYNLLKSDYDNSEPKLSGREQTTEHNFSAIYAKTELSTYYKGFDLALPLSVKRESFSLDSDQQSGLADIQNKSEHFYTAGIRGSCLLKTSWGKVSPGVSLESGSEEEFLPRASLLVESGHLSTAAAYRKTAVPPSFYDKFWQAGEVATGNPDLKTEKGESFSSYLAWKSDALTAKLFYSYTLNQDLISWQRTFWGWKPFNIGESSSEYWELSGKVRLSSSFWATGKVSRTIAKDRSDYDGKYIPYIPVAMAKASLSYQHKYFQVDVDYSQIGRQYTTRDQVNSSAYLEGYDFWDVRLKGSFAYRQFLFQPSATFFNVLDKEFSTYAFDPQPGFHWQTGLHLEYSLEK